MTSSAGCEILDLSDFFLFFRVFDEMGRRRWGHERRSKREDDAGGCRGQKKKGAMAITEVRQMKGWRDGSLSFSATVPLW